jgi:hypothetical protein
MTYQTDAQRDAAAEDAAGAALVPEPTPAERDALRRMLDADPSAYDLSMEAWDQDVPRCEFCDVAVPDGDSDYPPFCSSACEQAATAETYSSVHPRPEEVS